MRAYGERKVRHGLHQHNRCDVCYPGVSEKVGRARARREGRWESEVPVGYFDGLRKRLRAAPPLTEPDIEDPPFLLGAGEDTSG